MTAVEQAKQDRDAHWETCQDGCEPPWLRCDEGRHLHEVVAAAISDVWTPAR